MVVGVWWYDDFGINQGDQCIVKLSRLTPGPRKSISFWASLFQFHQGFILLVFCWLASERFNFDCAQFQSARRMLTWPINISHFLIIISNLQI
jgi:hypothetical protein